MNSLKPIGNTIKNISRPINSMATSMATNVSYVTSNAASMVSSPTSSLYMSIGIFVVLLVVFIVVLVFYHKEITYGFDSFYSSLRTALGSTTPLPVDPSSSTPEITKDDTPIVSSESPDSIVNKIIPMSKEVFNVSSNRYSYYDAEPLCKALGAELATYDQVKEAWAKGADWCNYGWVKGQQALYPTQKETWDKLQQGPEGDRLKCGEPGVNGGFFDNPEMRFGVNCFGSKPPQSQHDATKLEEGAPMSPEVLDYNKKVAKFRSQSDSLGVMPYNSEKWSSS